MFVYFTLIFTHPPGGGGGGGGGGDTPEKLGGGMRPATQKPSAYLWPESAIFPTLFMTWPKIWSPIYDLNLA